MFHVYTVLIHNKRMLYITVKMWIYMIFSYVLPSQVLSKYISVISGLTVIVIIVHSKYTQYTYVNPTYPGYPETYRKLTHGSPVTGGQ